MREPEQGGNDARKEEAGWSAGPPPRRVPTQAENEAAIATGRKFGLGCFTFVIGGFSGGMVAVLIGQIVDGLRKAPGCEGLPVCNWHLYVGIGGLIGAISLPFLVLRRITRKR